MGKRVAKSKQNRRMKSNTVYNDADNMVMVKTNGDEINIICNSENQMDEVVKRMTTDTCLLSSYEEWYVTKSSNLFLNIIEVMLYL